jgi:alpha-beta hydrolase superfamily lysophospholipase
VGGRDGIVTAAPAPAPVAASREKLSLQAPGQPRLALQLQRAAADNGTRPGDVIYVHGSTFGADLSVFFRLEGRSWADQLCGAGLNVWGFDFAGYGDSDRYRLPDGVPAGTLEQVLPQLHRVVTAVPERNGGKPVHLLAHSWGATVAAAYAAYAAGQSSDDLQPVGSLVLFAPVVARAGPAGAGYIPVPAAASSHYPLTAWAQYRRFIEEVPRGAPQVFAEAHFQTWSSAFLATDSASAMHTPPAVLTPTGPQQDVRALWSGQPLYETDAVSVPVLLVRGVWDSVCADADARSLLHALGSRHKDYVTIPAATHLMHLESGRALLYNAVNAFLSRSAK